MSIKPEDIQNKGPLKTATKQRSLETETVPVDSLTFDPANVRKHSERNIDAVRASLNRFGQQKPIVVNSEGVVIAGNGTLAAAKSLGWSEIQVVRTSLTGPDAIAFAIADNRTAELAEWDEADLAKTLAALQNDEEFDHLVAGFTDEEIAKLVDGVTGLSADDVVEDDVPDPPADPVTKPGDLWLLGDHRLLCGDSTKAEDVARLMGGEKADMCFTSPPYNAGNSKTGAYGGGSAGRKDFKRMYEHDLDSMTSNEYKKFLLVILDRVSDVCNESACVFWNVGYNASSRREYGEVVFSHPSLLVQETVVWDKSLGMNVCANNIYSRSAELVFLLSKTDKYKSNQCGGVYWNIWRIPTRDGDNMQNGHGASFPVKLPSIGIDQHSNFGDVIFEPFCGSGTTLIAAEPAYCDVIVKRWETLTGKTATREVAA